MSETIAKIAPDRKVELVNDDRMQKIEAVEAMDPQNAAFLARAILACSAALSGPHPPSVGTVGGDAHLPIVRWIVSSSNITHEPVLILSIPPGIELTFVMPRHGARELGDALIAQAQGTAPVEGQRGTVH